MRKLKAILILTTLIMSMSLVSITRAASVDPELWEDWKSGNAEYECKEIDSGGDYAYKIDEWHEVNGMDGTYFGYDGTVITIMNSDGGTFDWSSEIPVVAVIVVAGGKAYVYNYEEGSYGDTGLVAPDGKDISHVTFCFDIPDFVIPELPLGTISSVLVMFGAGLLLRGKTSVIK